MTRSKSIPIRSSRKPLDPYLSPASLPEEANQRRDGSKRCAQQIESGGDADVEIVTDTFDGRNKNRHRLGTSEIDKGGGGSQPLNLLEACIVCEISDDLVSKCCGTDCLLWFHEECLNAEFGSIGEEDPESSYCPYCWYRILAVKSIRLEEKAVGAEMAVFKYLDEEMGNRGGGEVNESVPRGQEDSVDTTDIVSDQEVEGEKGAYSSKEKQQVQVDEEDSVEESRGEDMELIEETAVKENFEVRTDKSEDMNVYIVVDDNEKAATENFQDAEDDKNDETAGDQSKANPGAGKERDVSQFLSMQESFSGKEDDQVQQNEMRRRKRRLILNAFDSDVSSNGSTNEPNGEDAAEKMTSLALVVTSPSGMMNNQQREHSRTTKVDNLKTVSDIPIFKKDHKKRLLWTSEEEYMLKVGVEKFSAESNKNMPWRKILAMGRKVFHEMRTPADLKDKWRNMTRARLKNKQDGTTVSGM